MGLPPAMTLCRLFSQVTRPMLGAGFEVDGDGPPHDASAWRAAIIQVAGAKPLTLAISADEASCAAIAAALFGVAPGEATAAMTDDALGELSNVTAGVLKWNLRLDQPLGIPRAASGLPPALAASGATRVALRASDSLRVVLSVIEGIA